jgi:hypothetical protein
MEAAAAATATMEESMTVFMVERNLKGISMEDLAGAQKAAISKAEEFSGRGTPARYIRSVFTPGDGRCMCLFEAENAGDVEALNREAQLPFDRVTEALDLAPAAS